MRDIVAEKLRKRPGAMHKEDTMSDKLNPVMDYDEHNRSYGLFMKMVTYGSIGSILVLVVMAITLL